MELSSPHASPPAVLVLCAAGQDPAELVAFCNGAGVLADAAHSTAEAREAFLACGGHDALLCLGARRTDIDALYRSLCAIDPELPLIELTATNRAAALSTLAGLGRDYSTK